MTSADLLQPDAMVSPTLRLTRQLGAGGMGSVWIARHLTLDTDVAVKFIHGQLAAPGSQIATRFEREAKVAARVKSPHVVQTFDHGAMTNGTPYIVMELLEGHALSDRLRQGPLSLEETALLIKQVGGVLAKAHEQKIIHRDIKPQNLFLVEGTGDIFVKVLDFGIAKDTASETDQKVTQTGMLLGTPLYMSPELVQSSKAPDARADLWALAVTVYECLAGCTPFEGETLGALMLKIVAASHTPITSIRSELPPALDEWFATSLNPNPDARFADAQSFIEAFAVASATAPSRTSLLSVSVARAEPPPPRQPQHMATTPLPENTQTEVLPSSIETNSFAGAANTVELPLHRSTIGKRVAWAGVLLIAIVAIVSAHTFMLDDDSTVVAAPTAPVTAAAAQPEASVESPVNASSQDNDSERRAEPEVSPAEDAAPRPADAPVAQPKPIPKAAKPTPAAAPPAEPSPPKGSCTGDAMFVLVDGKLIVRPECR